MFESSENLFKSVISDFSPPEKWIDHVHLAPACKERFLTMSDIPELPGEKFFMGGLAELRDEYLVERYGVDVHLLVFTVKGEGILTTNTSKVTLKENSLCILPAHTPYRFELNQESGMWDMAWLLLSDHPKWSSVKEMGQTVIPFEKSELVWSLMTLMYSEKEGRPAYRKLLCSELSGMLSGVEADPYTSSVRVQTLFNQVSSQLHLPWTVKLLAERAFLSEEQLNRLCKRLYSCSPQQKLISLRMEKAADLLHNREWSVSMIAQRLGYKDPYNFTHRFKAYYGCSPREYRKRLRINRP